MGKVTIRLGKNTYGASNNLISPMVTLKYHVALTVFTSKFSNFYQILLSV